MQVHKFGGASVRSAAALRNVSTILQAQDKPAVLVMSAMGKMTNALEAVVNAAHAASADLESASNHFLSFHRTVLAELALTAPQPLESSLEQLEKEFRRNLDKAGQVSYHQLYDAIVPFGELYSTTIAAYFLGQEGHEVVWLDARELVKTDDTYREARIDWDRTREAIATKLDSAARCFYLVQGFIGSAPNGTSTTLGREGSDFTAAIFASCIKAASVTLWKDVAGVFSADPKSYTAAARIPELSYIEALEMANYGAKVIHPKTLKPLENNLIPLYVRSFQDPTLEGTNIGKLESTPDYPPVIVKVPDLLLLRLQLKDLSYIGDEHLHGLFELFREMRIKVYMMQTGFITLSAGISIGREKLDRLIERLSARYNCRTHTELELMTVRHYRLPELDQLIDGREIFLEQRSLNTVQLLLSARD